METGLHQQIFARNVAKLIEYIYQSNYTCTLGEAFRTPEQAAIYAKEGKGIRDSLHCKRLAIDLNLFDPNDHYCKDDAAYEPFGAYWEELHPSNRWGGKFIRADGNHFEMKES